jgi:hypothetical protein
MGYFSLKTRQSSILNLKVYIYNFNSKTIFDFQSIWCTIPSGSRTSTYDEYLKNLKVVKPTGRECRYGVIDVEFQCKSSAVRIS